MTIGKYIRNKVIPEGMSVSKAAKKLGVGRPALSNLLNDNASLSPKMAARIERAFGFSAEELLSLQSEEEIAELSQTKAQLTVARQVPHLGRVTAIDFSRWGEELDTRALFPALLRKLIAPLGDGILHINFPAYDQSQKKGWDGRLETNKASTWIPLGRSVWEFGCNKNPQTKANEDYKKRTENTPASERTNTIYVFVTPHHVITLDANDLEHWVEYSLQAQTFMLEQLNKHHEAFRTIDVAWSEWADVCDPVFPHALFEKASLGYAEKLIPWLKNKPNSPFVVHANTTQEALAATASMFMIHNKLSQFTDRVVELVDVSGVSILQKTTVPMIVVVANSDIELRLANIPRLHHTIILRNKSLMYDDPSFAIDVLNSSEFSDALKKTKTDRAEIDQLSTITGGSLSVLRRKWSTIPQIQRPEWASQKDNATFIASVVLVGTWDSRNDSDRFIL